MKRTLNHLAGRLFREESGQTMVIATVSLIVILAMCGFVVDMGHAIVVNRQLEAGTNAAALAAGQALPATSYSTVGYDYSSESTDDNKYTNLPGVNSLVAGYCSSYVANTLGISCGGATGFNAVVVTQTVTIPTYFISVLGIDNITLSSTAIAAERGSTPIPYNVAIVLDQTASMSSNRDTDSQCSSYSSRETCAQAGLVTMIENMAPCPVTQSSCGSVTANSSGDGGANTTPAIDHIALFQFPNAKMGTQSNAYACNGSSTSNSTYRLTQTNITNYDPTTGAADTYLIVGYSSDFKTNPQTSTLSHSSNLVKALGGYSGCTPEYASGGAGTYYASVLYAAQASLSVEQKNNPNTENVIVLVSDGDATESASDLNQASAASGSNNPYNTTGQYPSGVDECNQAVIAGEAATNAGTKVYAVSYGSESSGCTNGSTGETAAYAGYTANITPCETMKGVASSSQYFYSDYTQSGSGSDSSCVGTATSTSNLQDIFTDIAYTLTTSRLLNPSANAGCSASNPSKCQ